MDPTLASHSTVVCSDCSESAPQLLWNLPSLLSLEVPSPSFLEFSLPGIAHFLLPWFIPSFGRAHLWDLEFLESFSLVSFLLLIVDNFLLPVFPFEKCFILYYLRDYLSFR